MERSPAGDAEGQRLDVELLEMGRQQPVKDLIERHLHRLDVGVAEECDPHLALGGASLRMLDVEEALAVRLAHDVADFVVRRGRRVDVGPELRVVPARSVAAVWKQCGHESQCSLRDDSDEEQRHRGEEQIEAELAHREIVPRPPNACKRRDVGRANAERVLRFAAPRG